MAGIGFSMTGIACATRGAVRPGVTGTDRRIAGRDGFGLAMGLAGAGRGIGTTWGGAASTGAAGSGATGSAARIGGSIFGMQPDTSSPAPMMRPMAPDVRLNP
ncbi:hypothetical protein [Sphingomonas fuzhouensis]|uniref:hypothetical protein n=1 Tax=Sphingomonas fuzhouensis TaxID=3106033 RepID=UPI002AFE0794|nr:hypothetical protein [Sphingomonas sp. SGZ-02]